MEAKPEKLEGGVANLGNAGDKDPELLPKEDLPEVIESKTKMDAPLDVPDPDEDDLDDLDG
jgi:hypothetical protein